MKNKIMPWIPAMFCGILSLITVTTDTVGRFATGTAHMGLSTFLCFLPLCFFYVGIVLKSLRDENQELKRQMEAILETQSSHRL